MDKLKERIINSKFFAQFKADWIRQASIDAFKKAREDLEETNVYDVETKAEELAKKKLNDLLSPVDLTKIVTLDKARGIVFIGGLKADELRLANLKSETEFLLQSDLWTLLKETPKELAQRSMFVSGETLADLQKGKSILYTLSTQQNIIDTLNSFQKKQPTPSTMTATPMP